MAFWNRVRQVKTKLNLYSKEISRYYVPHGVNVANQHISSNTCLTLLNKSNCVQNNGTFGFFSQVRFYAAPPQANQKKQQDKQASGPKLNEQITTPFIRLVTDEGHKVVPFREAMARAKSLEMDLVEVDSNAKPPVCKIMNYHKEKYLEKVKEKERAKSKITLKSGAFKEVRFATKITQNDLKMKAAMVKRLMDSGHRVKCTASGPPSPGNKGIEPTDNAVLETLLSRFYALIEDIAITESKGNVEKKHAFVVVRHVKFGPPRKKGSVKKTSEAAITSPAEQVGSEDISDEEDPGTIKSEWVVSNNDDDDGNIIDEVNEPPKGLKHEQPTSVSHVNSREVVKPAPDNSDASKQMGNPRYQVENRNARDPKRISNSINDPRSRNSQITDQAKNPQFDIRAPTQRRPTQPGQAPPVYNGSAIDRDPSCSRIPNSPSKSYGIFSDQQFGTTPNGHKTTEEFNRYKKKEYSESARSPLANRGRGIFNADNTNMNENQAQNQRR